MSNRIKDKTEETTVQDDDGVLMQRTGDFWVRVQNFATYLKGKIGNATITVAGLMSAADKVKSDAYPQPDGTAASQEKFLKTNAAGDAVELVSASTFGDMLKTTYDSNDDGKVDAADEADELAGLSGNNKIWVTDGAGNQVEVDISSLEVSLAATANAVKGIPHAVWSGSTTDATPTEIFLGGVASERYAPAANGIVGVMINIIAEKDDFSQGGSFTRKLLFRKNGASVSILGSVGTVGSDIDSGALSLAVALTADAVNGTLKVEVTGAAATNLNWKASAELIEV